MTKPTDLQKKAVDELAEREGRIERAQRNAYFEIGLELKAIRDGGLYKIERPVPVAGRYSFTTFEEYVETRWDMTRGRVYQLFDAVEKVQKMSTIVDVLPSRESHVRELLKLGTDEERVAVWRAVVDSGETITAKLVADEVVRFQTNKAKDWLTLDEWKALKDRPVSWPSDKKFNKQENDSIEWAQWSWNPITGCRHECPYCYARDIAERFFPQKFEPAIYPGRMSAPKNMRVPAEAEHDTRFRNVFTCSMADLFGRWVPAEWINAVLSVMRDNPEWNFLTLTKFPNRLSEFDIPPNAWMGTTVDLQARVANAEKAFSKIKTGIKWLSVEPMLEPLKFKRIDMFDWVVIGGASQSKNTPEWHPPYRWIADLVEQCRVSGVPVYFKTNLLGKTTARILELPFDSPIKGDDETLPSSLRYLGG